MKPPSKISTDTILLFDFACDHEQDGFTYAMVEAQYGWNRWYFGKVVRRVRRQLSQSGGYSLPCTPAGQKEEWLYKITTEFDDARIWSRWTLSKVEGFIETIGYNLAPLAEHEKDDLKKLRAKKILKGVNRIREDLAEIDEPLLRRHVS